MDDSFLLAIAACGVMYGLFAFYALFIEPRRRR